MKKIIKYSLGALLTFILLVGTHFASPYDTTSQNPQNWNNQINVADKWPQPWATSSFNVADKWPQPWATSSFNVADKWPQPWATSSFDVADKWPQPWATFSFKA